MSVRHIEVIDKRLFLSDRCQMTLDVESDISSRLRNRLSRRLYPASRERFISHVSTDGNLPYVKNVKLLR